MKVSVGGIEPHVTKDGSIIRELIRPEHQEGACMSLAEATVPEGGSTVSHIHRKSQEIYHIISGMGFMALGKMRFKVETGDSILILPGTPHHIENTGTGSLRILCCCHPPYDDGDTDLLGDNSRE